MSSGTTITATLAETRIAHSPNGWRSRHVHCAPSHQMATSKNITPNSTNTGHAWLNWRSTGRPQRLR